MKGNIGEHKCRALAPDPDCGKLLFVHCYTSGPRCYSVLTLLFLFQRNASLPDENNVVCLQEELIGVKLREAEALSGLKELRQQVRDLEEHWQVNTQSQRQLFYPQLENKCVCKLYCVAVLPCAVPFMLPFNSQMFKQGTLVLCCRGIWRARQVAGKTVRGRMQRVSSGWADEREAQRSRGTGWAQRIRQRMLELETQVSFTYDCSSLLYIVLSVHEKASF